MTGQRKHQAARRVVPRFDVASQISARQETVLQQLQAHDPWAQLNFSYESAFANGPHLNGLVDRSGGEGVLIQKLDAHHVATVTPVFLN